MEMMVTILILTLGILHGPGAAAHKEQIWGWISPGILKLIQVLHLKDTWQTNDILVHLQGMSRIY
jgi:hypothetical protein